MKTEHNFELGFDKFQLKVPQDLYYAGYDTWVRVEGENAVIGMTDFIQTKVGDIFFFNPVEAQALEQDEVLGTIESIKATVDITIPVSGDQLEFNPALKSSPELISHDPYGQGWIAKLHLTDWEMDKSMLLPANKYFELMQEKVKNALED